MWICYVTDVIHFQRVCFSSVRHICILFTIFIEKHTYNTVGYFLSLHFLAGMVSGENAGHVLWGSTVMRREKDHGPGRLCRPTSILKARKTSWALVYEDISGFWGLKWLLGILRHFAVCKASSEFGKCCHLKNCFFCFLRMLFFGF